MHSTIKRNFKVYIHKINKKSVIVDCWINDTLIDKGRELFIDESVTVVAPVEIDLVDVYEEVK